MELKLFFKLYRVTLFLTILIEYVSTNRCIPRYYKTGTVCVCNSTYCDTLEFDLPETNGEVLIVTTSESGFRFEQSTSQFEKFKPVLDPLFILRNVVTIDKSKKYQKIVGFGTTFTGAVSFNLDLVPKLKDNIYKTYFSSETGIAFNMMRIPIGATDADLGPWAYNEFPEDDYDLSNFTELDKRDLHRIEQLKELMEVTQNYEIKLIGTAWSSPKWMKTNNNWSGLGFIRDEHYQTWADYHVKYLELMKEEGIDYWAITTGNEPLNGALFFGYVRFVSLGWYPPSQAKWVSENLGPTLRNSSVADVKILAGDDQRYTFPWWFKEMYSAYPDSRNYVDGHAVHWYWNRLALPNVLDRTHERFPEKLLIASEASAGEKPWDQHRPIPGLWMRCQHYVLDIIEDLNHHVNAWMDWNLALDQYGGPNYVNNFVDAAVIINTTSQEEFYKQPFFYALGHFSRFVVPDSVRISSVSLAINIFSTAFLRPDGNTVVVLYNSAIYPVDIEVKDSSRGVLKLRVPSKSITTLLYK